MNDIQKIAESSLKQAGYHTITIRDKKYTIELLPATQALSIGMEIFKTLLPPMASWMDSKEKEQYVLPEENSMYTEVSLLLVNQLNKISVLDIVNILTKDVYHNGSKIDIDNEFKGNTAGLLVLLEFSLKENIGPLLQDWFEEKGFKIPFFSDQKTKQEDTTDK